MRPEAVIKGPIFSEKANLSLEAIGQKPGAKHDKEHHSFKREFVPKPRFVIQVDLNATKDDVRAALKELFDVDAVSVNTLIKRGKSKRRMRSRKGGGVVTTKKANIKKAYVLLKEGQSIPTPLDAQEAAAAEAAQA